MEPAAKMDPAAAKQTEQLPKRGCLVWMARFLVRHRCCAFWAFLVGTLLIGLTGAAILRARNDGQIFTAPGAYDWVVSDSITSIENDMVNDAEAQLRGEATRRRLGSEEEEETERASVYEGDQTLTILYYWRGDGARDGPTAGAADLWSAAQLQEMCELENEVFATDGYEAVCHRRADVAANATGGHACSLPIHSPVSLFYVQWDATTPRHDAALRLAAAAAAAQVTMNYTASVTSAAAAMANASSAEEQLLLRGAPLALALNETAHAAAAFSPALAVLAEQLSVAAAQTMAVATTMTAPPSASGQASQPTTTAANEPSASLLGVEATEAIGALLAAAAEAAAPLATMSADDVGRAEVWRGLPLRGHLHAAAPLLSRAEDAIVANGSRGLARNCRLLDAGYVAARAARLYDLAASSAALRAELGYFLSPDALTANRTWATRAYLPLGTPVRCSPGREVDDDGDAVACDEGALVHAREGSARVVAYTPAAYHDFSVALQRRLFRRFGMTERFLHSPWRDDAALATVQARFFAQQWVDAEFMELVNGDFLMVIASVVFVWLYMAVHTGSLALASLGMLMILLSLPLALFAYVTFFAIPYFSQMHILAVFIVLGVGADDIFVFTDAWRQSASEPPHISASLETRMVFTYVRTAHAVFNTSFTTALAFAGTAVSPVMPIAAFGVFAAIAIVANFVLVITWWPAVVLVWETHLQRTRGCGCCCPCIGGGARNNSKTSPNAPGEADDAAESSSPPTLVDRLFCDAYVPFILWPTAPSTDSDDVDAEEDAASSEPRAFGRDLQWPPRAADLGVLPVAAVLVMTLAVAGGWLTSRAFALEPPTKQEVYFPSDHMFTGLRDELADNFLAGAADAYEDGSLYLGLSGLERGAGFNKWQPAKGRGSVVFDAAFDLSNADAQAALLRLCTDLRTAPCAAHGCSRAPLLATPGTVACWLEDLRSYLGGDGTELPTGEAFHAAVAEWLPQDGPLGGAQHAARIGMIDGELRYVRLDYVMTMLKGEPPATVRAVYEEYRRFLAAAFLPSAPPSLATAFAVARTAEARRSTAFVWMVTQERLVQGVFTGFAICFPVAFVVLALATGSLRIATFAIVTIALIVGCLLGSCQVSGWPLGTGESIAGTIVIGLAVDYTVHLGHIYTEAAEARRTAKVRRAATVMGPTVVAGGVTTFGCACFMFPCQLTFFSKMATLIGGTIGLSVLYSLFFFMPLCALAGPTGEIRGTRERVKQLLGLRRGGKAGRVTPAPPAPRYAPGMPPIAQEQLREECRVESLAQGAVARVAAGAA